MKPVVKWLAISLLALLLLIASSLGLVLFSPWGTSFVLWGAQQALPHFQIEKTEGQLLDGLLLEGVDVQVANIDFKAKKLFIDLSSQCLLEKKLCVKTLNADGMKLIANISNTTEPEQSAETLVDEILAPLPIQVANVEFSDTYINAMGYELSFENFSTAANWQGNTLRLKPTQWRNISINLPESNQVVVQEETVVTARAKHLELPEVKLPLKLIIEEINLLDLKLNDELILSRLALQADAAESRVNLTHLFLDSPQAELTAFAEVDLEGNYPLFFDAKAKLKLDPLQQHEVGFKAQGDLTKLVFDANLAGKLKAIVSGQVNALDMDFPFELAVKSSNLQWPIQSADYQLTDTELTASGSLASYQAKLKTAFKGSALPSVKLSTELKGDLYQLALEQLSVHTLAGVISGNASANWQNDISWHSALNFKNIQPGSFWQEAEGKVSGDFAQSGKFSTSSGWEMDVSTLDLKGEIRKQALNLQGKFYAAGNTDGDRLLVKTQGLSLRHGKNSLIVTGEIDEKMALDINLNFPSIASSLPQMKGNAKGKVSLFGTVDKPQANIDLKASNLWVQDDVLAISEAKIQGNVGLTSLLAGELGIELKNLKAEGVDLKNLALRLSGDEKKHSLSLIVNGEPLSSNIKIDGSFANNLWKGNIARSDLETPLGKWALNKKTSVQFDAKKTALSLDAFCLAQKDSQICIDNVKTELNKGKARLAVKHFDLANLNKFLPKGTRVQGDLKGETDIAWQSAVLPKVDLNFAISQGRFIQRLNPSQSPLRLDIDKVALSALVDKNKLDSKLNLDLGKNGSASFDLVMNQLASDNRTVSSHFSVNKVNLNILAPVLEKNAKLAGVLDGDLSLSGNLNAPKANGKIELAGLKLQSLSAPVEISNGSVIMSLNGQQGNMLGKITTPDGQLEVKGDADWRKMDDWLASVRLSSKKLTFEMPPMINMQMAPDLEMKASPRGIEVSGKVGVPWGRVKLEQLPASAVQASGDLVILNEERKPITPERQSTSLPFNAELVVALGEDVRLEAFGLKTNLMGKLDVESTEKGINILGEISLEEGTYRSFGQDLKISEGLIRFTGPAEQPYLQVTAIRNPDSIEDGVEAGIRVMGTPDAPNVEIFSIPSMVQAQALSYLTRGRALDSEAGGDAVTSMLIGLGLSQSGMVVGKIGEAFGVKDLSLDTAGQGDDEQVVVSGYILPGLQVKYGVGIFTSVPEFTLRYNLLKNLYLEAVSGADTAVDLLYQFSIQ